MAFVLPLGSVAFALLLGSAAFVLSRLFCRSVLLLGSATFVLPHLFCCSVWAYTDFLLASAQILASKRNFLCKFEIIWACIFFFSSTAQIIEICWAKCSYFYIYAQTPLYFFHFSRNCFSIWAFKTTFFLYAQIGPSNSLVSSSILTSLPQPHFFHTYISSIISITSQLKNHIKKTSGITQSHKPDALFLT